MATERVDSQCLNCGFTAAGDSGKWAAVDVPRLGTLTQCPECNSTNVLSGR